MIKNFSFLFILLLTLPLFADKSAKVIRTFTDGKTSEEILKLEKLNGSTYRLQIPVAKIGTRSWKKWKDVEHIDIKLTDELLSVCGENMLMNLIMYSDQSEIRFAPFYLSVYENLSVD